MSDKMDRMLIKGMIVMLILSIIAITVLIVFTDVSYGDEYNFTEYQTDSFNTYLDSNQARDYNNWLNSQRVLDTQWRLQQQINTLKDDYDPEANRAPTPPQNFRVGQ